MSQGYQWFAASDLKIFKSSNWKVVWVKRPLPIVRKEDEFLLVLIGFIVLAS